MRTNDNFGPRPSLPREYIPARQLTPEETAATMGAVSEGPGIDVTDNKISADLATDPGMEFDVAGDAGKTRVKVDPNGGLARLAVGMGLNYAGGAKYDVFYVNAAGTITRGILKLRA